MNSFKIPLDQVEYFLLKLKTNYCYFFEVHTAVLMHLLFVIHSVIEELSSVFDIHVPVVSELLENFYLKIECYNTGS